MRDFLHQVICSRKAYSKCEEQLPVTAEMKGHGQGKLLLFAYLPSLLVASSAILWLLYSFTGVRIHFVKFPVWTEDQ